MTFLKKIAHIFCSIKKKIVEASWVATEVAIYTKLPYDNTKMHKRPQPNQCKVIQI